MHTGQSNCQIEQIRSYLDGELDQTAASLFEAHLKECSCCAAELAGQQRMLGELDSVLYRASDLPLPKDFARIVAARAESDMSGLRERREHRRALRVCVLLGFASLALLGLAAQGLVLNSALTVTRPLSAVLDVVWRTLYDAANGLNIISRVLSRSFVRDSHLAGLLAFVVLGLAVLALSRLIANYHRTRLVE